VPQDIFALRAEQSNSICYSAPFARQQIANTQDTCCILLLDNMQIMQMQQLADAA